MSDELGGLNNSKSDDPSKKVTPTEDVTNLKAEVNRKLGNYEESLQKLQEQNKQLLDQMTVQQQTLQAAQAKKAAPTENVKLSELIYDNPDKAVEIIQQRANDAALSVVAKRDAAQAQQSQTIANIVKDYPEVSDANHALTKRAVELYNKMPELDKQLPMSYRVAVMEAAAEQSILPHSKREKVDTEAFSLSGSSSGGQQRGADNSQNEEAMLKFAALMGIDTNDAKALERLKGRTGRNYKRYK